MRERGSESERLRGCRFVHVPINAGVIVTREKSLTNIGNDGITLRPARERALQPCQASSLAGRKVMPVLHLDAVDNIDSDL